MQRSLNSILNEASDFITSEFYLELRKSQLKICSTKNWEKFCKINNFEFNNDGLYLPKFYSAYVRVDSPVLISNIFHEFFGHGLFCEHSVIGKSLVNVTQTTKGNESVLYKTISPNFHQLGLTKDYIGNYEGFALWLESLLCEKTCNKKIWENKKDSLPKKHLSWFEYFQDAEERLTRLGFMSKLGFPKNYNPKNIIDGLKHLYDDHFKDIIFILSYGPRKPESDIDLFIVSDNLSQKIFNGWLDIYELDKKVFQGLVNNMDISITDPLFSGDFIYGDREYVEKIKQEIKNQPITKQQVIHNFLQAEKQKEYLSNLEISTKIVDCLIGIESYIQNAKELYRGNKVLTLQRIKEKYRIF